jgi:NADH:ubiquinone oxidoreductase subunit 2 (subunit N)
VDVRLFVIIAIGSAALALLTRSDRRLALVAGFGGLVACVVAALLLDEAANADVVGGSLVATGFLRWFLVIGSLGALAACLVALATRWQRDLPAATLAALGGCALALSIESPPVALLAATAAGAVGLISLATPQAEAGASRLMLGYLYGIVVSGAIAVIAAAWLIGQRGPLQFDTLAGGAAALAMALALGIRMAAVPFHAPAARVVRAAVPLGIPLLLGFLPVLVFLVALSWTHRVLLPQPVDLDTVRVLVAFAGAGSLLVGGLGTLGRSRETDDVQHVISYGIVQDAGFFLLAFAAFDASVWREARMWSLYFLASKVGLAAWLAAILATRGSASIPTLDGWARRSPLLAVALVGAVAAGLGLPGLDSWDARFAIIHSAADRPLRWIAYAGWALAYVPFARLLWVGVRSLGDPLPLRARMRLRTPPERPVWPDLRGIAQYVGGSAVLSRLAIATVLTLAIGVGSVVLALGSPGLSEAAAVLPEPVPPAVTAAPSP